MEWLAAALALSLLGSLHCFGMCGGFAVLSHSGANKSTFFGPLMQYLAGKTTMYVAAGAVFGGLGTALHQFPDGTRVLAILVGALMIWVGADMAGVNPLSGLVRSSGPGWLVNLMARFASSVKTGNRFVLGVLNGLLPCGLLYAAFAGAASTASPVKGGLFMLAFGLGTVPSLVAAARLAAAFSTRNRQIMARLSGWAVILFGLFTMLRGTSMLGMMMH